MRRMFYNTAVFAWLALTATGVWANDTEIAQEIANQLAGSGQFPGHPIAVRYQDGTVWLKGRLPSKAQEERALSMVYGRLDVKQVVNMLAVDGAAPSAPAAAPAPSAAALPRPASNTAEPSVPAPAIPPSPVAASAAPALPPSPSAKPAEPLSARFDRLFPAGERGSESSQGSIASQVVTRPESGVRPVAALQAIPTSQISDAPLYSTPFNEQEPEAQPSAPQQRPMQQQMQQRPMASIAQRQAPAPMPRVQSAQRQPLGRPIHYNSSRQVQGEVGGPIPAQVMPVQAGQLPAVYDQPHLPNHAWPAYAAYPNYAGVSYPKQYSPTAWPYIGPFYPYPQVPLGWRKVTMEWDDGWWWLDFQDGGRGHDPCWK